jgi:NifU-like protein involved in Fe-S cluster formation
LACGDDIEVFLKTEDGKIKDFSFEWDTSIISTACASIFGESIVWMTLEEVLAKKYSYIEELIWMEVSPRRKNASVLWMLVTINTIHDYLKDGINLDFDDLMDD